MRLFSRDGRIQISLGERMQSANTAWWRDAFFRKASVKEYLIVCTPSSVLGARTGDGPKAVRDTVTEWETRILRILLRMTKKEDEKVQNYCRRTAWMARNIVATKNGVPFVVRVDCRRNLENNGMVQRRIEE